MILATAAARSCSGPFLAACALLVVAGVGKVRAPGPARTAARAAGLAVPGAGIVGFGLLEIGFGVAGAVFGAWFALGVAACFSLLAFVAVRLLRRAPATPCACLGSAQAVVTRAHVAIDVAAALVAVAAGSGGSPWAQVRGHWFAGAVFVVLVATCVKLAMLALETLPELTGAAGEGVR